MRKSSVFLITSFLVLFTSGFSAHAQQTAEKRPLIETPSMRLAGAKTVFITRTHGSRIPSGAVIAARYAQFVKELPEWCVRQHLVISQLTYGDNYLLISDWLKTNPVV